MAMNKTTLTKSALATALGISRQAVHRYQKKGMPCDTIGVAQAWRLNCVRMRIAEPRPPSATAQIRHAHEMQEAGALLLSQDMRTAFEAMVPTIRETLRAVPRRHRLQVRVSASVMDVLLAPVMEAVKKEAAEIRAEERVLFPQFAQEMDDAQADDDLLLFYECAAGEWIVSNGDVDYVG